VFFDLNEEHQFSEAALAGLIEGVKLRGFFGGIILRGQGHKMDVTGKMLLTQSATPSESTIGKNKSSLLNFGRTQSVKVTDNVHFGAMLMWSEFHFSQFGFDLIAMMQGTYEVGRISSFHGMGSSEWEQKQP